MKNKILRGLAFFLVPCSFLLASCEDDDLYDVGAPGWLDGKINDIAAQRQAEAGDGVETIIVTKNKVGADDFSTGNFGECSQNFELPVGKTLTIELTNDGKAEEVWQFFEPVCATIGRGTKDDGGNDDSYAEYFVLNHNFGGNIVYGTGVKDYPLNTADATNDFDQAFGTTGDGWKEPFKVAMKGAHVVCQYEFTKSGYLYLTNTITATDGTVFHEYYNQKVNPAQSVWCFITGEFASVSIDKAYLSPCERVVDDAEPTKLTLAGFTTTLEVGTEDYIGALAATVTYDDGSESKVKVDDLSFMAPDVNKLGEQTVIAMYSKTKLGNPAKNSIAATWQVSIVNPVSQLNATIAKHYYIDGVDSVEVSRALVTFAAKYSDGTDAELTAADPKLTFGKISVADGKCTVTYESAGGPVTETVTVEMAKASDNAGTSTDAAFFAEHSKDYPVASGAKVTKSFTCYSAALENWHGPVIVLRSVSTAPNADGVDVKTEYGVMRGDNYGWGGGYADKATPSCDWVWDDFKAGLNGSRWTVEVENVGDGKANVHCTIVDGLGNSHFQNYDGIEVTANDLELNFTTERAYLVFD